MPMRLRDRRAARLLLLAVVALAATAAAVASAASEDADLRSEAAPPTSAWQGLVGGPRPEVTVGQRTIVLVRGAARALGRARDRGEAQTLADDRACRAGAADREPRREGRPHPS